MHLGYYDENEIDRVVNVVLDPKSKQKTWKRPSPRRRPITEEVMGEPDARAEASRSAEEQKSGPEQPKTRMDALILFRADMAPICGLYTFLSQIFDYGNTDFEKRAIFFKFLIRLLKFGREREGVDLSEVKLTHHKLRNRGRRNLGLSDDDAPKLKPLTEVGSGALQEKQKVFLSEIIEQLNTLFGSDTTEGDQLSYANTLAEKTLESEKLQQQAANNSKEQFSNSPDLNGEILDAIMESMDAQSELSTKALNSAEIREGLKKILLDRFDLYEKLRGRATGA